MHARAHARTHTHTHTHTMRSCHLLLVIAHKSTWTITPSSTTKLLYTGVWSLHIYSLFSDLLFFSWLSHTCFFYCREGDWNLFVYNSSPHQRRAENSCSPQDFLISSFAHWTLRLTVNVGTTGWKWLLYAPPAVTFNSVGKVHGAFV
jgi:hypothetical protein